MRNKEIEQCIFNLTSGIQCKDIPGNLKKISDYIERLERENFGLRTKVSNLSEKEEARKRELRWNK